MDKPQCDVMSSKRYLDDVNQSPYKIIPKKLKRKKMSKGTNNDTQNTTQKTKD